jgi:hypothetical protein
MQGHRHDHVGIGQQLRAGPDHHAAHGTGELQTIVVFEAVHEQARGPVIFRHGPGTPEDRWVCDGGGREERLAEINGKGQSQPFAEGPLNEADARPAGGAQGMRLPGGGLAGDAGRRVEKAESHAPCLSRARAEAGTQRD